MGIHDRCVIDDYSEAEGSSMAGLLPRANGKVRRHGHQMLCDRCAESIRANIRAITPPEPETKHGQ